METPTPPKKRRTKRSPGLDEQAWYPMTALFDLTDNDGLAKLAEGLTSEAPNAAEMAAMSRLFYGLCRRLALAENGAQATAEASKAYQKLDVLPLTAADRAEVPLGRSVNRSEGPCPNTKIFSTSTTRTRGKSVTS